MTQERLEGLASRAEAGEVHTVRVGWTDRLGAWRGKRVPVNLFLRSPERRISFCDGMIVVDVNGDIIQETPFSNFTTGYPDMYLRPRLETLRPVGWAQGEAFVLGQLEDHGGDPLEVAPANVLDAVCERLATAGLVLGAALTLNGRLRSGRERGSAGRVGRDDGVALLTAAAEGLEASEIEVRSLEMRPDGRFSVALGAAALPAAANGAAIAKAALKELAARAGSQALFMTLLPGEAAPAQLQVDLELTGARSPDPNLLAGALGAARGLLQPSVNAFKAGPAPPPEREEGRLTGLRASSEADPATALAVFAAAVGAAAGGAFEPPAETPEGLLGAADALAASPWAEDWLGAPFVENAVPLLRHEAGLFAAAVTDWELDRYWSAG